MKRKFLLLVMMCLFGGLSSSLMAQDETVVTIGSTTSTRTNGNFPIAGHKNYSISQTFYKSADINMADGGTIRKISYMVSSSSAYTCSSKLKIYMRNTDTNNFPSSGGNWYTMTAGEKVFEGKVDFTQKGAWITITLDTPFTYERGKNILVCVQAETTKVDGTVMFLTKSQTGGTLYVNNDDNYYDITSSAPGTKSRVGYIPITQFTFGLAADATVPNPEFSTYENQYAPLNGAEDVLNPYFQFVSTNTTNYKILLSKSDDFSNVQYIKGSADAWATKDSKKNTVTTEKFSNLDAGTTYYWKVTAKNISSGIESEKVESGIFTFTTAATAEPEQLESCSPALETVCYDGYPTLTWEYGANSAQYQLLLGDTANLTEKNHLKVSWNTASILGDSYQTSGLAVGTYYWQVNVKNGNYITEGEVYSFTIPGVKNISNAEASDTELTWTFDEYATQYRVLLGTPRTDNDANKDPLEVYCNYLEQFQTAWMDVPADKQGSFTLPTSDIVAGKKYYWTVEVKNFADDKIYSNYVTEYDDENKPYKVFTPEVDIYSFVTSSMTPVDNTDPKNDTKDLNNPELRWSFNGSSATYYQVYLGTDKDNLTGQGWTAREKAEVGGVEEYKANGSFQTSNLTANTTYYWRVDVTDAEDPTAEGISVYEGATWSFLSHLPAPEPSANPTQIKPTYAIVYGGTTISWNALNGVTGYNVYLGETKLNSDLLGANHNYYTIAPEDRKLQYNMKDEEGNGGYDIYVDAVY